MLEFVLCFPILFVLFLFVMQLAQIMITWQVVHYAAYMGARSSMTTNLLYRQSTAEKVVKRVLAVVSASSLFSPCRRCRGCEDAFCCRIYCRS